MLRQKRFFLSAVLIDVAYKWQKQKIHQGIIIIKKTLTLKFIFNAFFHLAKQRRVAHFTTNLRCDGALIMKLLYTVYILTTDWIITLLIRLFA